MPSPITISYHGITRTVREWADFLDIDYYTLLTRVRRGWSAKRTIETPLCHKGSGPKTHGMTGTKEYRAWQSMKFRCMNAKGNNRWHRYAGRGITVCERWRDSFQAFYADVGPAPSENHSLGRWDHDGDYEPGNRNYEPCGNQVTWQSAEEQTAAWKKSQRRGNTV